MSEPRDWITPLFTAFAALARCVNVCVRDATPEVFGGGCPFAAVLWCSGDDFKWNFS
jgi:hypothetical protein